MSRPIIALLAAAILAAGPAFADAQADRVVQGLLDDGYGSIQVERTWLGRTRIVAARDGIRREIVLDRGTGEILRDLSEDGNGETVTDDGGRNPGQGSNGGRSDDGRDGGRGRGSGGGDDGSGGGGRDGGGSGEGGGDGGGDSGDGGGGGDSGGGDGGGHSGDGGGGGGGNSGHGGGSGGGGDDGGGEGRGGGDDD